LRSIEERVQTNVTTFFIPGQAQAKIVLKLRAGSILSTAVSNTRSIGPTGKTARDISE
jgi:hypothetical protein